MISRLCAAWAALSGQPVYATLPPARLLDLGPEDRVLLECEQHLTKGQVLQLNEYMTSWLEGTERRVAVLSGGIRLVVVRNRPIAL